MGANSNLSFCDQMVRVEKGWVENEFVLFVICQITTWNKVSKWVNILQDSIINSVFHFQVLFKKMFVSFYLDLKMELAL